MVFGGRVREGRETELRREGVPEAGWSQLSSEKIESGEQRRESEKSWPCLRW